MGKIKIQPLINLYRRLLTVERFNTTPHLLRENIGAHMHFTSMLVMILGGDTDALEMAMVHDTEETFSGDMVFTAKHLDPILDKELGRVAERFLDIIIKDLPTKERWKKLWIEFKEQKTDNARLVKIADLLSQVIIMIIQYRTGNMEALIPASNSYNLLLDRQAPLEILEEVRAIMKENDMPIYDEVIWEG